MNIAACTAAQDAESKATQPREATRPGAGPHATPGEAARLEALRALDILDSPREASFQRLVAFAAALFGVPCALISLVDANRQWFKAAYGIDLTETCRADSFCTRTIMDDSVHLVLDTWQDLTYRINPLVTGAPFIRFYAGAPLRTAAGHRIGTLCLIDTIPHEDFDDAQCARLTALAEIVMDELALRETRVSLAEAARNACAGWEQAERERAVKADFVATMAHEVRTPLNGIIGMADMLLETGLTPQQDACAQTLKSAANHFLTVINDVLDVSKLEAGNAALLPIRTEIAGMVRDVLSVLMPAARSKQIKLAAMLDTDLPRDLVFDSPKYKQILINIIGNAVKFTRHGGVTAELSCRPAPQPGMLLLRCAVRDTGIGIAAEDVAQLFTRFSQPNAEVARAYGGTGLGLAISKDLAVLLGGDIWVSSVPGIGSVFTIEIPVPAAEAMAETVPDVASPAPKPMASLRILLVEDNETNQKVAAAMFRRLGHELTIAGDGVTGIAAVSTGLYDVVFMDMMMPGLDGPASVRGIRKLRGPVAQTYIIALTANASPAHREACLAAGMNDFVAKPATKLQLEEALNRYLATRVEAQTA